MTPTEFYAAIGRACEAPDLATVSGLATTALVEALGNNAAAYLPGFELLIARKWRGDGPRPPLVIIESPYAATDAAGKAANVDYARACMRHSISRFEAPFASHLLYAQPGVLDDTDAHERSVGIAAGLAWAAFAQLTAVYADRGISSGMKVGIDHAKRCGRPVEYRTMEGT